jgi:hypothetical protein
MEANSNGNVQQNEAPTMAPENTRAVAEVARLGTTAYKNGVRDDAVMRQMSELSRFAHGIGAKPSWFENTAPDARTTDLRPASSMAHSDLEAGMAPMAPNQAANMITHGKVVGGLSAEMSSGIVELAQIAGLPEAVTRILLDRTARHASSDSGLGSFDSLAAIDSTEDKAELSAIGAELYGNSPERFKAARDRVERFLKAKDAEMAKAFLRSSLSYDRRVLDAINLAAVRDNVS